MKALLPIALIFITNCVFALPVDSTDEEASIEVDRAGNLLIVSDDFLSADQITPNYYSNLDMRFIHMECDGKHFKLLVNKHEQETAYQAFSGQHCIGKGVKKVLIKIGEHSRTFYLN